MNIKIRKIEESDFEELISLFKEFALFEKTPEKMTNTLENMKADQEFINGFVAVSNKNEVLGYATFFFVYFTWTGKSLYMDDLYVRKDIRGHGIGTSLIKEVINFAKKEKCKKLHWQVSDWNKSAIEFYKKLGAQVDSVESNCDLTINA